MKVRGRLKKVCEDCMEELEAQSEVESEAESAVRDMMGYWRLVIQPSVVSCMRCIYRHDPVRGRLILQVILANFDTTAS